ncbi:hypothetical protein [Xanthomonas graminis]|uniref:hypothetical protein n=1 Tax=Xanthomonas graminis TaxID=3390026 RepID=UPI0012DAAE85|nr:hypothetical protein [Xanthomonas translucens]UKE78203.1 hypothetical protein KM317_02850 [Xanthomonas translucens pv. arrhenatheri]
MSFAAAIRPSVAHVKAALQVVRATGVDLLFFPRHPGGFWKICRFRQCALEDRMGHGGDKEPSQINRDEHQSLPSTFPTWACPDIQLEFVKVQLSRAMVASRMNTPCGRGKDFDPEGCRPQPSSEISVGTILVKVCA